jgi:hypothetical protein
MQNPFKISLLILTFLPLMCFGQANQFTQQNAGKIYARINQYDTQRFNFLTNQTRVLLKGKNKLSFQESTWEVKINTKSVANKTNATDYEVTFKCITGKLAQASVSVDIDFENWSEKNFVLMPAAVYNGNRFAWRKLRYSPKLHDIKDIGIDKPIIINDVPKLNEQSGFSRIQERSGSMSTPSIGFISEESKKGVWLLTKQGNSLGDYGMDIEETRDRKKATITLTSPVVRELYNYTNCNAHSPTWDVPKDFKTNDEVTISFRLYTFEAPENQAIFNTFAEIRKDVANDHSLVNALPFSECMQTLESKFNAKNFVPEHGYYSVGFRENYLQDWQIGWVGGMMSTLPLLFAGNEQTKQNVLRNFDFLYPNGISPSGFYWDCGRNGTEWLGGDIRNMHTKNWHLVRKSGDAIWYITKQFMLMEKMNIPVKQSWKDGNQKVCEAFMKLWRNNHQLGQFVDSQTGEILVGGSSSGGIVPAGLALAAKYYQKPAYLETAKEIADYFNQNFTKKGIACGGPGDGMQNMDSESAYGLVESYVGLFEATQDKKWLEIAENATKQFATWVVSYNYQFPDSSAYHKLKMHTTGTVYANIQNKHTAPNICTASGIGILRLFEHTGNPFYAELIKDIAHGNTQYLAHPTRPIPEMLMGNVSERINMTDWEGKNSIGYVLPMTSWAETSLMLTTVEIPGIYVQAKKGIFIGFDNIEVEKVSENDKEMVLKITNPSPVKAEIIIYEAKEKPMPENALYGLPKVELNSKEAKILRFQK